MATTKMTLMMLGRFSNFVSVPAPALFVFCLSICLCLSLSLCLSESVFLWACLPRRACLPFCLCISLTLYLFKCVALYLSACLPCVCLCLSLSLCPSECVSICFLALPVCPSLSLSLSPSECVCLCVCLLACPGCLPPTWWLRYGSISTFLIKGCFSRVDPQMQRRCRDAEDNFYDRTEGVGQRQKHVAQPEALDAATLLGQKVRSAILALQVMLCCAWCCAVTWLMLSLSRSQPHSKHCSKCCLHVSLCSFSCLLMPASLVGAAYQHMAWESMLLLLARSYLLSSSLTPPQLSHSLAHMPTDLWPTLTHSLSPLTHTHTHTFTHSLTHSLSHSQICHIWHILTDAPYLPPRHTPVIVSSSLEQRWFSFLHAVGHDVPVKAQGAPQVHMSCAAPGHACSYENV